MRSKIIIPSEYRYTSVVRKFVYAFASNLGFTYSALRDLILVLDELMNNAIEHGYKMDPTKHIEVVCKVEGKYLALSVTDFGVGFDLRKYKIPSAQDFDYYVTERGRGLFLVNSLADRVIYDVNFENGTRVLIKKKIPSHIQQSIEYFKENRQYFEGLAKKFSVISNLSISLQIYEAEQRFEYIPHASVCKLISRVSNYRDLCESFHYKMRNKPADKFISACPLSFLCAGVPLTYKMENIGLFVIEPVITSEADKKRILNNFKKMNIGADYIEKIKKELDKVAVISREKLNALVDTLSMMANQIPIIRMQKDELQLLNSRIQSQNQKLKFLYEVTRTLAMAFRPQEEIFNYIYGVVKNIVGQCKITYWEYNESSRILTQHQNRTKKLRLAEGITGWVAYTGKAALVSNLSLDSRYRPDMEGQKDARTMLSIPIVSKKRLIGVIDLIRTVKQQDFSIVDLQTLSMFFVFIGYLIENNELYYQMNRQLEELSKLNMLTNTLVTIFDIDELLRVAVNKVAELMEAEKCSIMLLKDNELLIKAAHGIDMDIISKTRLKVGQGVAGWVVEKGESLLITDIEKDPRFRVKKNRKYKSKSFLSVPIKIKDKAIGVLNVTNRIDNQPFTKKDMNLLEIFATSVALALQNIEYVEQLKNK